VGDLISRVDCTCTVPGYVPQSGKRNQPIVTRWLFRMGVSVTLWEVLRLHNIQPNGSLRLLMEATYVRVTILFPFEEGGRQMAFSTVGFREHHLTEYSCFQAQAVSADPRGRQCGCPIKMPSSSPLGVSLARHYGESTAVEYCLPASIRAISFSLQSPKCPQIEPPPI
jgi:hypothetical protein